MRKYFFGHKQIIRLRPLGAARWVLPPGAVSVFEIVFIFHVHINYML